MRPTDDTSNGLDPTVNCIPKNPPKLFRKGGPLEEDAVKLAAVWFEPLTVTCVLAGENVNPDLLGVTLYDPFARPVNE